MTDLVPEVEAQLKKKLYVPSGSEMVFHYEAPRPPNEVTSEAVPFLGMRPARSPFHGGRPHIEDRPNLKPLLEKSEPDLGSHRYRLEVHG